MAETLLKCLKISLITISNDPLKRHKVLIKILEIYNQAYDKQVRQFGKVTFSDLIHLLNPKSSLSLFTVQIMQLKSNSITDSMHVMTIGYLMNFKIRAERNGKLLKIWLMKRYKILSELPFLLGTQKQSLYLWRNSDDRLFQSICDYYQNVIETPTKLSKSYRSAPAIMDAVNSVFDNRQAIQEYYGSITSKRWFRAWENIILQKTSKRKLDTPPG